MNGRARRGELGAGNDHFTANVDIMKSTPSAEDDESVNAAGSIDKEKKCEKGSCSRSCRCFSSLRRYLRHPGADGIASTFLRLAIHIHQGERRAKPLREDRAHDRQSVEHRPSLFC